MLGDDVVWFQYPSFFSPLQRAPPSPAVRRPALYVPQRHCFRALLSALVVVLELSAQFPAAEPRLSLGS